MTETHRKSLFFSKICRNLKTGKTLGLAFQLADDLEDREEDGNRNVNWANYLGKEKAQNTLIQLTKECLSFIHLQKESTKLFKELILFNCNRVGIDVL